MINTCYVDLTEGSFFVAYKDYDPGDKDNDSRDVTIVSYCAFDPDVQQELDNNRDLVKYIENFELRLKLAVIAGIICFNDCLNEDFKGDLYE